MDSFALGSKNLLIAAHSDDSEMFGISTARDRSGMSAGARHTPTPMKESETYFAFCHRSFVEISCCGEVGVLHHFLSLKQLNSSD